MSANLPNIKICWICREPATTREHKFKQSLVKDVFSDHGDSSKIYLYQNGKKARHLQSPDSVHIKYEKNLCQKCNNVRTQPYDRAYDKFTKILKTDKDLIIKNKFITLSGFTQTERHNLFRYFAKEFGCKLVEFKEVPSTIVDMMSDKNYGDNLMIYFLCGNYVDAKITDIIEQSEIDFRSKGEKKIIQYHFTLGWISYLVCYVNLPSKDIKKILKSKELKTPWFGKSKKIFVEKA